MNAKKNLWPIYDCELVDAACEGGGSPRLVKAIKVSSGEPVRLAAGLPRGFTTYPLLDYDFSDDAQVLAFVKKFGLVCCPYGGAPARTRALIEGADIYDNLMPPATREKRDDGETVFTVGRSVLAKALGPFKDILGPTSAGKDLASPGFDSSDFDLEGLAWEIMDDGMVASDESSYLRKQERGFVRQFMHDEMLPDTERIRVIARAADDGSPASSPSGQRGCLIALEEVRYTLYLLQVASIVLQGFAMIDRLTYERTITGQKRRIYQEGLLPKADVAARAETPEESAKAGRVNPAWAARHVSGMEVDIRRIERLWALFFKGRPNLLKALKSVAPGSIARFDGNKRPFAPTDVLTAEEGERIDGFVKHAKSNLAHDADTIALLDELPLWQGWTKINGFGVDDLESNLAVFMEACLTNCWGTRGHELVETEELRVGYLADENPSFTTGYCGMSLQRAIAEQLTHYLADAKDDWKICLVCGEPFYLRNKSAEIVTPEECESNRRESKKRQTRRRPPKLEFCSNAHRKRDYDKGKQAQ